MEGHLYNDIEWSQFIPVRFDYSYHLLNEQNRLHIVFLNFLLFIFHMNFKNMWNLPHCVKLRKVWITQKNLFKYSTDNNMEWCGIDWKNLFFVMDYTGKENSFWRMFNRVSARYMGRARQYRKYTYLKYIVFIF